MGKLYLFKLDKLYGFIDRDGNYIIKPMYQDADSFSDGLAYVKTIDNKKGYIDENNKMVILYNSDGRGRKYKSGMAVISQTKKDGFIDKTGNIVISPIFDRVVSEFSDNNTAVVMVEKKYGLIDISGKYIIEPEFDYMYNISEDIIVVKKDNKYGCIDTHKNVLIDFKYDNMFPFSEGLSVVLQDGMYGFVNKQGNTEIKPEFHMAYSFHSGYARFKNVDGIYGFIDKTGKVVLAGYEYLEDFSEDFAVYKKDSMYGYLNLDFKPIFEEKLSAAASFKDGLAQVSIKGVWGYINNSGKWIIKP